MPAGDVIHTLLPWIDGATVVGIPVGAAKVAEWLEGILSPNGRTTLARWLTNTSDPDSESGPSVFSNLIDRVFGTRAFSIKFFLRSCVASFIAVFLASVIYKRLGNHLHPLMPPNEGFSLFLLCAIATNLFPDYCSLLVSRYIVRAIAQKPTVVRMLELFIANFILTTCVSLVGTVIGFGIVLTTLYAATGVNVFVASIISFHDLAEFARHPLSWLSLGLIGSPALAWLGVFFYSAFFTLLWMWIYIASALVIKALHRLKGQWTRLSKYLDIETKPLVCVGKVSGLILGALYAVLATLLHFGHKLHF